MLPNPVPMDSDITSKSGIHVSVRSPIMHITWDEGQYTSYAICLETCNVSFAYPKTVVRRRYSEFVKLRRMLKAQHPTINPPNLPPRTFFADKFCPNFVRGRQKGLETFLEEVFENHLYLSNRSLHLFIQSNLPMDGIESIVCGQARKQIKSEPHLILCPCPVPESEVYSSQCNREWSGSFSSVSDNKEQDYNEDDDHDDEYGSTDMLAHISPSTRITFDSPRLEVPTDMALPDISEDQVLEVGSADSDYSSIIGNSSPTTDKCNLSHGILHFRSSSQNSSVSGSPVRKKKVSFNSEVTVAHLLTE